MLSCLNGTSVPRLKPVVDRYRFLILSGLGFDTDTLFKRNILTENSPSTNKDLSIISQMSTTLHVVPSITLNFAIFWQQEEAPDYLI